MGANQPSLTYPAVDRSWVTAHPEVGRRLRRRYNDSAGRRGSDTAGTQPCGGIVWRAHRDHQRGAAASLLRSSRDHIGSADPDALRMPARRAEYSLTEIALSPFQTEPTHMQASTVLDPETSESIADGTGGPFIRCPKCGWTPRPEDRWRCSCGHSWNTFDTGGVCPRCRYQWKITKCLRCKEWSAHSDWYAVK